MWGVLDENVSIAVTCFKLKLSICVSYLLPYLFVPHSINVEHGLVGQVSIFLCMHERHFNTETSLSVEFVSKHACDQCFCCQGRCIDCFMARCFMGD